MRGTATTRTGSGTKIWKAGCGSSPQRAADGARGRVERPRDQQRCEREGQLEGEADQERGLHDDRPRHVTGMREPLGELLDDERDRRQQDDQR